KKARQFVAEAAVALTRPTQRNRPKRNDRRRIPGPPTPLRLIISEVRDAEGKTLAVWYLFTNVPEDKADASRIALWYYWRWTIETFFKLLKSAGLQVEGWGQETAGAIARRLLVACMACVVVWRLARSEAPQASETRRLLVRLSGRQMRHGREFTMPALLAGYWKLLAMISIQEECDLEELKALLQTALGGPPQPQPPPPCKHS
ncbi:MAG: transposase, partial [Planctomycetales bacterium]